MFPNFKEVIELFVPKKTDHTRKIYEVYEKLQSNISQYESFTSTMAEKGIFTEEELSILKSTKLGSIWETCFALYEQLAQIYDERNKIFSTVEIEDAHAKEKIREKQYKFKSCLESIKSDIENHAI